MSAVNDIVIDMEELLVVNGSLYMPNAWAPWRAYCWSAIRNSADNLKYGFAWKTGPLVEFTWLGHTGKVGWQAESGGYKVPVLSLSGP